MLKNIVIATIVASSMAIELTPDNWEEQTAGKTVFVKFFAPWCGHCKAMKPAWDGLMDKYADSSNILIGDVDCIGSGKALCETAGVQGFPTVKFGDPSNLEDYKGGRDETSLAAFAEELKPGCDVATLDNCDDDQKEAITSLLEETTAALADKIDVHDKAMLDIEESFKSSVGELQKTFQGLNEIKTKDIEELKKTSNIGIVKSVHLYKKKGKEEL